MERWLVFPVKDQVMTKWLHYSSCDKLKHRYKPISDENYLAFKKKSIEYASRNGILRESICLLFQTSSRFQSCIHVSGNPKSQGFFIWPGWPQNSINYLVSTMSEDVWWWNSLLKPFFPYLALSVFTCPFTIQFFFFTPYLALTNKFWSLTLTWPCARLSTWWEVFLLPVHVSSACRTLLASWTLS